jgi:ABC-type transporter Mla maintaining outer membrane lipid asymmetry permease subunit MlaE
LADHAAAGLFNKSAGLFNRTAGLFNWMHAIAPILVSCRIKAVPKGNTMRNLKSMIVNAMTFERTLGFAAAFVVAASAFALLHAFGGADFAGQVTMLVVG